MKVSSQDLVDAATSAVTTLTVSDAFQLFSENQAIFIDLREASELESEGKIPGAFHAPRGNIEFWVDPASPYFKDVFASEKPFVFYCAASLRSVLATFAVQKMGLPRVSHFEGGFEAWVEAGYPVERL